MRTGDKCVEIISRRRRSQSRHAPCVSNWV